MSDPKDAPNAGSASDEERAHRFLYPHDEPEIGRCDVDVINLVGLLTAVRDEERETCARRLERLGEKGAAGFLRYLAVRAPRAPIGETHGTICPVDEVRCIQRGQHAKHDNGLGSTWTDAEAVGGSPLFRPGDPVLVKASGRTGIVLDAETRTGRLFFVVVDPDTDEQLGRWLFEQLAPSTAASSKPERAAETAPSSGSAEDVSALEAEALRDPIVRAAYRENLTQRVRRETVEAVVKWLQDPERIEEQYVSAWDHGDTLRRNPDAPFTSQSEKKT